MLKGSDDDLCIPAVLPELQLCQCSLSCVRLAEPQQTKRRQKAMMIMTAFVFHN